MMAIRRVVAMSVADPRVVEDRDRPAALVEVDHRTRALEVGATLRLRPSGGLVVGGQPRASLSYGMPSAAGGTARPTTPARTMIVKM